MTADADFARIDLSELMVRHQISVWMDPDWWEGSGAPRWLAEEGCYYSTLTGSDPSSIEADNTGSGDTPLAAVLACIKEIESAP